MPFSILCLPSRFSRPFFLPLSFSLFPKSSKIRICFTFLVPAHLDSPGQRAVKRVCVCVPFPYSGFSLYIPPLSCPFPLPIFSFPLTTLHLLLPLPAFRSAINPARSLWENLPVRWRKYRRRPPPAVLAMGAMESAPCNYLACGRLMRRRRDVRRSLGRESVLHARHEVALQPVRSAVLLDLSVALDECARAAVCSKKLCYRRRTARRAVSVETLSTDFARL